MEHLLKKEVITNGMKPIHECEFGSKCKWPPFHTWRNSQAPFTFTFLEAHKKYCGGEIFTYELKRVGGN